MCEERNSGEWSAERLVDKLALLGQADQAQPLDAGGPLFLLPAPTRASRRTEYLTWLRVADFVPGSGLTRSPSPPAVPGLAERQPEVPAQRDVSHPRN